MATATLKAQVRQLQTEVAALRKPTNPTLDRLRADPARLLSEAGFPPDPWQADLLRHPAQRTLLLCSRQAGKSTVAAALALRAALLSPPALVLLLSPTLRQSGELFRAHFLTYYKALGRPVPTVQETALTMQLANGSRIVSLPGEEGGIRSFSSVRLLIVDEASRVPDDLYRAVRPMLAVSRGQLVCLSTPFGQRGWFHDEWHGSGNWKRVRITANDVPRITPEFLAEERKALGERWFNQEYLCSFEASIASLFSYEDLQASIKADIQPCPMPD
jgi:Terminase large subunit, T4likevirus-type, N-terminal